MDNGMYIEFFMQSGYIFYGWVSETQLARVKEYLNIHGGGCEKVVDREGREVVIVLDQVVAIRYTEKEE